MAASIHNLIAAINPDLYCNSETKKEVKELSSEGKYLEAAKVAKLKDAEYIDFIDIVYKNANNSPGLKAPIEKHLLSYDSFGEGLEQVYFWILDKMSEEFKKVEKISDNFVSSPGSNYFSEMGMRLTKMQEEASKMLGAANTVVKSILNIVYDLKEFQTRLKVYDKLNSNEKVEKDSAIFSLKQIWMDTVDIKRGNSSIKALALSQQGGFVTLIDAFMAAEDEKLSFNGQPMDLNDRIKRILQQRLVEFFIWIKESERELRKRFEIEKTYLKSQVSTVQLYSRWAKPYLKATRALEQNQGASSNPALITSFNTLLLELSILGEAEYKPDEDITKGDLPKMFRDIVKNPKTKKYSSIMVIEFNFRSVPERTNQGYGFRGKVDVTFTSYGLSNQELKLLRKLMVDDDMKDVLGLIEGATTESLDQLQMDIDEFLGDKKEKEEKKKESEDTNPFSALFSSFTDLFSSKEEKSEKKESKEEDKTTPDSYVEKILRSQAIIDARRRCYKLYDLYKKTHGMASLPGYA